jgi:PAS domain S-box-containing protein
MLSFSEISLLADLTLCSMLIFLWLTQRKEKHALLWGCGQLSLAVMAYYWGQGPGTTLPGLRGEILSLLLVAGLSGYWFGTQYFLGERIKLRRYLPSFLALAVCTATLSHLNHHWAQAAGLAVIGMTLLWCGRQLTLKSRAYRWVGTVLLARGCLNYVYAFAALSVEVPQSLFALGVVFKTLSVFGLIYAVLDEMQNRHQATINSIGNGFIIRDINGNIHSANTRCAKLFGFAAADDLVGQNILQLMPGRSAEEVAAWFRQVTAADSPSPMISEIKLQPSSGPEIPIELISVPYHERGQTLVLSQFFDITERKRKEARLMRYATTDELSGLCNRHSLNLGLAGTLDANQAQDLECSLLFIDLDHFKRINDSFGHSLGDALLILVAARLQSLARPEDILARFGGDEFVIVQPSLPKGAGDSHACALAHASLGIALSPEHGLDAESLIRAADIAMYSAKAAGRNEFRLFDAELDAAARNTMQIEEAMRSALQNHEFKLVYQPIVEAGTGHLKKVEALIRWHSATLGFVSPDRFIPVAEASGLIVEIGRWVLQEGCRQARSWADSPIGPICVSVNVSAWQLVDRGFLTDVREAIGHSGIRPQQLELELTERVLIEEADSVRGVLESLHEMGVSISLDDFGTGYSSLSYLTRFRLDTLKIDRAFITHIENSPRDSALVRAIIVMGHSLGLQIVAEGVETAGQAQMLGELGCERLQGYFFSRPVPAAEITAPEVGAAP